eukprot:scaffold158040_cov28-Attheya_sp.AAC.1
MLSRLEEERQRKRAASHGGCTAPLNRPSRWEEERQRKRDRGSVPRPMGDVPLHSIGRAGGRKRDRGSVPRPMGDVPLHSTC